MRHVFLFIFWIFQTACHTQQKESPSQPISDPALIKEELMVINQTLRYLDPNQSTPNWDSPYRGVMSQGLEGEPVWVGFMSGIFMPIPMNFDQRVNDFEANWNKQFQDVDTSFQAVLHKLLDLRDPNFPPDIASLPPDKWPKGSPDDVMWQDRKGFKASDTYTIYAFTTPAWLELHALSDEKILLFPYRKLGTLSISHVVFSDDKQLACYLYDMWGYSVQRSGVILARKINNKWVWECEAGLGIS